MSIIYNGTRVSSIKFNGVNVQTVYYCNTQDGSCTKVFPDNCVCVNYAEHTPNSIGCIDSPFLQCDVRNLAEGTSCTVGDWTVTKRHSTSSSVSCYSLTLNVDCDINSYIVNNVYTRNLCSNDTVDITAQAMAADGYECMCSCVSVRAFTTGDLGCGECYCACVCRGISNVISGTATNTESSLTGRYCIPASFTIKAATYCGKFTHTIAYNNCPLQFYTEICCPSCCLCTITTTTFNGDTKTFCRIFGSQIYEY